jgi:hypothetical protein
MRSARADSYGAEEASERHRGSRIERAACASSTDVNATWWNGASDRSPARRGGEVAADMPSIGYLVPPDGPT